MNIEGKEREQKVRCMVSVSEEYLNSYITLLENSQTFLDLIPLAFRDQIFLLK